MIRTAPIVTIFGGSGFVGRYVAQQMARRGWRVRVAVRRPNEAHFVRPYGDVGQVEPIQANIRDDESTRAAILGAEAVVNCVGILAPSGRQTFEAVQRDGAARIARIAAESGVRRLVQISAIADADTGSRYAETKLAGEDAVREAFPGAVILRPSIVFGPEDGFFNRFAGMARLSPVLPLIGAETRFQPVYVGDVATAAAVAASGEAEAGATYELGGPEVMTFRELIRLMLRVIRRRRLVMAMPWPLARLMAWGLDLLQTVTFGLFTNGIVTRDQVKLLERDNVVAEDARTLADLGIQPTAVESVLESYLYAYRPQGQYTELVEEARRLKI